MDSELTDKTMGGSQHAQFSQTNMTRSMKCEKPPAEVTGTKLMQALTAFSPNTSSPNPFPYTKGGGSGVATGVSPSPGTDSKMGNSTKA